MTTNPFHFVGCVEVRQALDRRALDERELMDRLEEVPAGSIFYHTHGYFLRHRPLTTAYGNDFARWVGVEVRDRKGTPETLDTDEGARRIGELGQVRQIRCKFLFRMIEGGKHEGRGSNVVRPLAGFAHPREVIYRRNLGLFCPHTTHSAM